MDRRDVIVLRITAVWTFFIWAVFVRNLIGDDEHSAGFKAVHLFLAAVSVALAAAVWQVASRGRRRARDRAGTH